jgi:hypothetical protein
LEIFILKLLFLGFVFILSDEKRLCVLKFVFIFLLRNFSLFLDYAKQQLIILQGKCKVKKSDSFSFNNIPLVIFSKPQASFCLAKT